METTVYLFFEIAVFSLLIIFFYRIINNKNNLYLFLFKSILLFFSLYILALIFNRLYFQLLKIGVDIDLGHAAQLNALIWIFYIIISSILVLLKFLFYFKQRRKTSPNK